MVTVGASTDFPCLPRPFWPHAMLPHLHILKDEVPRIFHSSNASPQECSVFYFGKVAANVSTEYWKHYANKQAGSENRAYSGNPDSAKGAAGTKWSITGTLGWIRRSETGPEFVSNPGNTRCINKTKMYVDTHLWHTKFGRNGLIGIAILTPFS